METRRKIVCCELVLIGLTALFLGLVCGLFLRDRAAAAGTAPAGVERNAFPDTLQIEIRPLNLNSASLEELSALPGIGEVLARRILEHLEANGPFETVEDLMNVSGIGMGKLMELEGLVTVEELE